jgi:hypothetical protein
MCWLLSVCVPAQIEWSETIISEPPTSNYNFIWCGLTVFSDIERSHQYSVCDERQYHHLRRTSARAGSYEAPLAALNNVESRRGSTLAPFTAGLVRFERTHSLDRHQPDRKPDSLICNRKRLSRVAPRVRDGEQYCNPQSSWIRTDSDAGFFKAILWYFGAFLSIYLNICGSFITLIIFLLSIFLINYATTPMTFWSK